MALPRVTPGTYNYGEYANPTPIRYGDGGLAALGQGIAQGVASIVSGIKEKKEEAKQKKQQDQLLIAKQLQDSYSRVSKDARKKNTAEVNRFANEAAQLAVNFKGGLIDADTYTQEMTLINDALDDLNTVESLKKQINLDNISPQFIKDTASLNNYALQMQLQNDSAKRIWDEKEKQWFIEYDAVIPEKLNADEIKSLNGIPDSAYEKKRIPVSEITANPKNFFEIKTRIQETDAQMQTVFNTLANDFNKNQGRIYMTDISDNGYELLNETKAIDGYKNSSGVELIYQKLGKDIAEDILDVDYEKDKDQVKAYIAQQAILKADKVGNKVAVSRPKTEKDPVEERTGLDLQDRANFVKQLLSSKEGEPIEIKFKGTNDFRKEDYVLYKEGDKIMYKKEGQEPMEISQGDLVKEFGLQELLTQSKADQAGFKF